MEQILEIYQFIVAYGPDVLRGLLEGLGALLILANVTPFEWDEKALAKVVSVLKKIQSILPVKKKESN